MDTIIGIIKNPVGFVLCSFVIIIIFIVIREFWCWYYKTNKIYEELDDIHRHLIKVSKDITEILDEAMNRYNQAAEKGDPEAQYKLGLRYYDGNGVRRDYAEAVKWFTQAAEQGHAYAQYYLGICYQTGTGINQDLKQAKLWYIKAAAQGHEYAQIKLSELGYVFF